MLISFRTAGICLTAGVVLSPQVAYASQQPDTATPAFVLEEVWRIGGIDAIPEAEFAGPHFVTAFGPDGEATILDQSQARISIFDGATGEFLRAFGRNGQGPGELHSPSAMTWDSRGRLWVANAFNGRYTVFDALGQFLKIVPRPMHVTGLWVFPLVVTGNGQIMDHKPASGRVQVVLLDSLGSVQDSVSFQRQLVSRPDVGFLLPGSELARSLSGTSALLPTTYWGYAPDARSIWLIRSDSLSLMRISLAGDTVRQVRLTHRSTDFTPTQREAVQRARHALREDIEFRPIMVQRLHVLDDGRLLVQVGNDATVPSREFELFDSTGTWLGSVTAPFLIHNRSELSSRGDTLLVPAVGQLDVPLLIKAVLKPSGEAREPHS